MVSADEEFYHYCIGKPDNTAMSTNQLIKQEKEGSPLSSASGAPGERTVVMSPDANRSSVSNDAVCYAGEKHGMVGSVLSHQQMAPLSPVERKPKNTDHDANSASRGIPVSFPISRVLFSDVELGTTQLEQGRKRGENPSRVAVVLLRF